MAQTLILAKSILEANRYAKAAGLDRFTYRAVRSAGSIRGVRHAEVHILPSFLDRLDRHSILGALRWAKTLEVFYVDPADFEDRDERGILTDELYCMAYDEHIARGHDLPEPTEEEKARVAAIVDRITPRAGLSDEEKADLEEILEPEGWEPPEILSTEQVLVLAANPDARGADVLEETNAPSGTTEQGEGAAPTEEPKRRTRRSRCGTCGELHFAHEPCVQTVRPVVAANDLFG